MSDLPPVCAVYMPRLFSVSFCGVWTVA